MKFIPYPDKVQIRPIKVDSMLQSEDGSMMEMGEVLEVGTECTFLERGDLVFFSSWGVWETADEENKCYVIAEKSEFILGKYKSAMSPIHGTRKK